MMYGTRNVAALTHGLRHFWLAVLATSGLMTVASSPAQAATIIYNSEADFLAAVPTAARQQLVSDVHDRIVVSGQTETLGQGAVTLTATPPANQSPATVCGAGVSCFAGAAIAGEVYNTATTGCDYAGIPRNSYQFALCTAAVITSDGNPPLPLSVSSTTNALGLFISASDTAIIAYQIDGGLGTVALNRGLNFIGFSDTAPIDVSFGGPVGLGISAFDIATPAAVPEPASWAMMICGFGLIGGALRGRRRVVSVLG